MKKFLFLVISIFLITYKINASKIIIPTNAIRFRVIANSNSNYDQKIKLELKDMIQVDLYDLLKSSNNLEESRKIINENMNYLSLKVKNYLNNLEYNENYNIKYGMNFFPEKNFKGIKYKEGYYESLVITLGEGKGDNWWCVLFPPLCLLEAEESDKVEYKFKVKELIEKYF